jgi:hypothetical protein
MVCHAAIERGVLKASGRAPDQITGEGPFGVIEEPIESASEELTSSDAGYEDVGGEKDESEESDESDESIATPMARETPPGYGKPIDDSRESWVECLQNVQQPRIC